MERIEETPVANDAPVKKGSPILLRTYVLAGVLAAAGAYFAFSARPAQATKTEDDLEKLAPYSMPAYRYVPSPDDPDQSYKMSQSTYDVLVPYGIVARRFEGTNKAFDVVLIASNKKESFHDPRVCFSAQGWNIIQEDRIQIPTKTRGTISASLAQLQHAEMGKGFAVYFYRGPKNFSPTTMGIKLDIFWEQLFGQGNTDGVFYRFIPLYRDASKEDLVTFIGEYMDAANESSGGYF